MNRLSRIRLYTGVFLVLGGASLASAHEGPAYSIVEGRQSGPYVISVWADPDLGAGEIYVVVLPAPMPAEATLAVTGTFTATAGGSRLPQRFEGRAAPIGGVTGARYVIDVPFDVDGVWNVVLQIAGAPGTAELGFSVEVPPEGPQLWEVSFYILPFVALALAFAFARARSRKRPG